MITFTWKDSFRQEWTATGSSEHYDVDTETALWWFTAKAQLPMSIIRFPVEMHMDDKPGKRDVSLALMAYFNSVALSLMTGETKE